MGSVPSYCRSWHKSGLSRHHRRRRPRSLTDSSDNTDEDPHGRRGRFNRRLQLSFILPLLSTFFLKTHSFLSLPLLHPSCIWIQHFGPWACKIWSAVSLGDRHACATIDPCEGVVDVMDMEGGRTVGWPFSKTVLLPQILVFGVCDPHAVTGEVMVTTYRNLASSMPLGS